MKSMKLLFSLLVITLPLSNTLAMQALISNDAQTPQLSQGTIAGVMKFPALDKALDALAKTDAAIEKFGSDTKEGLESVAGALETTANAGQEMTYDLKQLAEKLDITTQKMTGALTQNVSAITNTVENIAGQTTAALNETTEKFQKIADTTTKSLNTVSLDTRLALSDTTRKFEHVINNGLNKTEAVLNTTTTQITGSVDSAVKDVKDVVNKSLPQLIKTAAISGAGLACSIGGVILFVKGIQKAYASYKEEAKPVEQHKSFMQKCKSVLMHPCMLGMYQAGTGLATIAAGIITIAKSEQIIAWFA